jgi:hypothetical protein
VLPAPDPAAGAGAGALLPLEPVVWATAGPISSTVVAPSARYVNHRVFI